MALPLIGLIGRKRSGKDTVADLLIEHHGYNKAAFADPLRDLLAAINPVVASFDNRINDGRGPVHFNDATEALGYEVAKDSLREYRRLLEVTGTEGVRETLGVKYRLRELLDNDVWPAIAELRIEGAIDYVTVNPMWQIDGGKFNRVHWRESLAFTDVRFANEAELITRHGGILVRVARPSLPANPNPHVSETALDDYEEDYTLVNDGSLADLRVAVDSLVAKLR